jgi:hypothetical protein
MVDGDRLAQTVRAEAAIALGVGSALVGATAARVVFPGEAGSAAVLAGMLAVLGLAAGTRPNRTQEDSGIEWLAVFGMLVSVPATVALAQPSGVCLALFLAPPAGLALAALWWSLLAAMRELDAGSTLEDADVGKQIAGRWLALIGGVTAPTAILASDLTLGLAALAVAAFGGARAAHGGRRRRARTRWLARTLAGEESGYRVVPAEAFPPEHLTGLPALVRSSAPAAGVLVARHDAEGPYRERGLGTPLARVPLANAMPESTRWSLPWGAMRSAIAIIGALFAPLMSLLLSAAAAEVLTRGAGACASGADLLCGWLLLLSGPSTGAALLVLSHLHRPTRATVWWLGISIYLLACPFVCLLVSFAARLACL